MGRAETTSGLYPGWSTGGEPTPDKVGSGQEVGDSRKNVKVKYASPEEKVMYHKSIVALKFEGCTEELKVCVFDLHDINQADILNQEIKGITKYVNLEIDTIAGKILRYLNIIIFSKPKNPELNQGESAMDDIDKTIIQEDKKEYIIKNIYIYNNPE